MYKQLVLTGSDLGTEELIEDVKLTYRDDGAVEVHKWVSEILWDSFQGMAKVCKER